MSGQGMLSNHLDLKPTTERTKVLQVNKRRYYDSYSEYTPRSSEDYRPPPVLGDIWMPLSMDRDVTYTPKTFDWASILAMNYL